MTILTRVARGSLAIVAVTIAAVVWLRQTTTAEVSELRDQLVALEQQVQQLNESPATVRRPSPATQKAATPVAAPKDIPAQRDATSKQRDEQTVFDEMLVRAGMEAGSVQPHELRRAPVSASQVGQRLLTSFNTSALAEHAFVTHSGCVGSSCAMEVTFNDARSAIEQETSLARWLSEADGSCSFTLDALAPDFSAGSASISRRVSIDCG
jgi:hypothetical protein